MTDDRETQLDALLRDVGRRARQSAPPFERTWRGAQSRIAEPRSSPAFSRVAAAAALAAAVAIALALYGPRDERASDARLARWHSPTAALLATSAYESPSAPRLGDSAVRGLDFPLNNLAELK
jgi:hypothetical protein